jgi:TetR/AcrR family transcriptional regulator
MTEKEPTRIQKKNRATILAAGLDVFSKFGFRGATLDQVAEAAGMSKPNLLYYFPSKGAIYTLLLEQLLATWLDPLIKMDDHGDPVEEIVAYTHRKLDLARDYPRESRLFANEMLQGAPRLQGVLATDLKALVDTKAEVIKGWSASGKIGPIDPHHLIFSIWSLTQHYADFEVQVSAVLGRDDYFQDAAAHLEQMIRKSLAL